MTLLDNTTVASCTKILKHIFFSACVLTALCLFFYPYPLANMNPRKFVVQTPSASRSVLMFLKNAMHELQTLIMLPRKRKLVLLWTPCYGQDNWIPSTQELECHVSDCDVTSNRSLLAQSSAIVLHWRSLNVSDLPECPKGDQYPPWVLFNREAPPYTSKDTLSKIQDRVHWTATYRKDSDIYAPYGKVVERKNPVVYDYDPNRRLVCWLVSNCNTPSKREFFVRNLQKHIEVDIFGKCGTHKCPHELTEDCYQWLSKRCKFYLALENSNCRDYVTEKLYTALAFGMVPIVKGISSNYVNLLPPRSYINADDFFSPKELAEYLVIVGENQKMYQSYHWWRTRYTATVTYHKWFCELCEKLHDNTYGLSIAIPGKDLKKWWFDQSVCATDAHWTPASMFPKNT